MNVIPPSTVPRTVVFISKATPADDEFVLWLAPRLEAAGYTVFADILTLEPGERWRKEITNTLQTRAIKMLLCCRDFTLASEGVQEEIGIASDLVKELKDPKFIIPLRLEAFKKLFGIGELQYIDFVRGWADGLGKLLDTLKRQKVFCDTSRVQINPNWETYRRRGAIPIKNEPERLTSNWLRVAEAPDVIRYFGPTGAADRFALASACRESRYPAEPHVHGFFSFGTLPEMNDALASIGKFEVKHEVGLLKFVEEGSEECSIRKQDASNMVHSMFRQSWNRYCRDRGLLEYQYSKDAGFHASEAQVKIGQKIPWGKQGDQRSSMLRNVAKGSVWQFGVSSLPAFWPFPHFKLKSRVLFAPLYAEKAGDPFDDAKKQHRLRRTVCKGWRNKQWHGRIMAFIELLSGEASSIALPLGETAQIRLEAAPILFTSPVSTFLPNKLGDEQEEEDVSTLGRPEPEEEQ
jgi:TIR domain-containing protein